MTHHNLLAGSVAALGLTLAASGAFAASKADSWFACQTWAPTKASSTLMTNCATWTRDAAARMRGAPCDPAKMSAQAMRERCAEFSSSARANAKPSNG